VYILMRFLQLAAWCSLIAVPAVAGSTETIVWKGGGWIVATTESDGRVVGCHTYADYQKGTRFVLALYRNAEWRGALGEHGGLNDLRPGPVRLIVDGHVIFDGQADAFPGGGIRLGSLSPRVVKAISDGHKLGVLTPSGSRVLTLAGSEDALGKVRDCLASVFELEQKKGDVARYNVKSGVSGGMVNLRSEPSTDSGVIAEIPEGSEPLRPLGKCAPTQDDDSASTWCRFQWRQLTGWVSMRVVVADMANTALSVPPAASYSPSTVNTQPPPSKTSSGTAFFISKGGHLLTNFHVVDACQSVTISQPGASGAIAATILARDKSNDLALLLTSPNSFPNLLDGAGRGYPALRRQVRLGENIAVFGYPLTGIVASTGNFVRGSVTALAGLVDDTSVMQIDAPVQSGNSGGPVLDERGNVIAIVVGKLDDLKFAKATGSIPQQINFAIKANTAAGFLEANGVAFEEPIKDAPRLEAPDLADYARRFTVHVTCKG